MSDPTPIEAINSAEVLSKVIHNVSILYNYVHYPNQKSELFDKVKSNGKSNIDNLQKYFTELLEIIILENQKEN